MSIEEKYLGKSLDYYLKSQEQQFLKLKKYMKMSQCAKIMTIVAIILFSLYILLSFLIIGYDFIELDVIHTIIILYCSVFLFITAVILRWFSNKKIKNVLLNILSEYIGGIKPISRFKYLFLTSIITKFRQIGFWDQYGLRTTVSYAFHVEEEDFSYDIYYVDVDKVEKEYGRKYSRTRTIKVFDGVVVIFETLPEDIKQSVISNKNNKIKLIKEQMAYLTSKINNNKIEYLQLSNMEDIRNWAEETIIEIVKMKELIKNDIETMKKEVKEEYFF